MRRQRHILVALTREREALPTVQDLEWKRDSCGRARKMSSQPRLEPWTVRSIVIWCTDYPIPMPKYGCVIKIRKVLYPSTTYGVQIHNINVGIFDEPR